MLNILITSCYPFLVIRAHHPRPLSSAKPLRSRRPRVRLFSRLSHNPYPLESHRFKSSAGYRRSPSPKSFPCHTSENSPISPATATDPKTPISNPCVCHTSETPRGECHKLLTRNPTRDLPAAAGRRVLVASPDCIGTTAGSELVGKDLFSSLGKGCSLPHPCRLSPIQ